MYCDFKGGHYVIDHPTLKRAKCPKCGAVRTLAARVEYYLFPTHRPAESSTMKNYLELEGQTFVYKGDLLEIPEEKPRGFLTMSVEKRKEIASRGGTLAHQMGVAHTWTSEEASLAGQKGGGSRWKKAKRE